MVPSCARDADCKRLAGEQFGENHPKESDNAHYYTSMDEEEHVVHGPQPLVNAGKSLYCVRDLQRLQVCRTLRINMRSKWQVINWQNGRSYLLSKKDHGGDRKSDGYIIESSCQLDNLIEPKTEDKNIFGKIIENFLKYKIITRE